MKIVLNVLKMFWNIEIKLKPHSRVIMGGSSLLRTQLSATHYQPLMKLYHCIDLSNIEGRFSCTEAWYVIQHEMITTFFLPLSCRYDDGRILAYQSRTPDRFYYILAGRGEHWLVTMDSKKGGMHVATTTTNNYYMTTVVFVLVNVFCLMLFCLEKPIEYI